MKSKILLFICAAFSLTLSAQQAPILTLSDFPYVKSSFDYEYRLTSSAVAAPKPGVKQVWNYGKEILPTSGSYTFEKYSEPSVPALTHVEFGFQENVTPNLYIDYDDLLGLNANGFQIIGRNYPPQKYGIGGLTGTVTDSFTIEDQFVLYPNPIPSMKFPMTIGTNWTSDATRQYSAKLTISNFGVKNADFVKRSREVRKDSVVGWGDIIVPIGTKPSTPFQCLMIHRYITVVDSIFLDGKPAPPALLQAFGLVQGNKTETTRKIFWRSKELYPAALFRYNGNKFNTFVSFSANQHENLVSAEDDVSEAKISIYPNPSNGIFSIIGVENAAVQVSNIMGQTLLVPFVNNNLDLSSQPSGIYFMQIKGQKEVFTLVKE
jgi:hypothetical protein